MSLPCPDTTLPSRTPLVVHAARLLRTPPLMFSSRFRDRELVRLIFLVDKSICRRHLGLLDPTHESVWCQHFAVFSLFFQVDDSSILISGSPNLLS